MRILAFDPGHTTGFALIEDGKILLSGAVDYRLDCFSKLIALSQADLVIIEDIPTMTADRITQEIFSSIKYMLVDWIDLLIVKPGQWKMFRSDKEKKFIPHVRDAIGLAQYAERISKDA